jgi:hypothetical protein
MLEVAHRQYRQHGGPAARPEDVVAIAPPCTDPAPTLPRGPSLLSQSRTVPAPATR